MKHALITIFGLYLSKRQPIPDEEPKYVYMVHRRPLPTSWIENETTLDKPTNMKGKFVFTGKYQNGELEYPIYDFVGFE